MNLNKKLMFDDKFESDSLIDKLKMVVLAEVTAKVQELCHGQVDPMIKLRKAIRQVEDYSPKDLLIMAGV